MVQEQQKIIGIGDVVYENMYVGAVWKRGSKIYIIYIGIFWYA